MYIQDWLWYDLDETSSTNDVAIELSANSEDEKYIVSAKKQTNGRGRRGREWHSQKGNLFFSQAVKDHVDILNKLPFIVSLVLLETIMYFEPKASVKIKWPNDILANDGKISGILLEKASNDYVIIGVGVNIVSSPTSNISYKTTSLKQMGIDVDRIEFLKQYLEKFDEKMKYLQNYGFTSIIKNWLEHAVGLGQKIVVNSEKNSEDGVFCGLDADGALLLRQNEHIKKIYAGDIFIKKDNTENE